VELGKPSQTPCKHLASPYGCSIYSSRPKSCADFNCLWLLGYIPEQFRPDKCGIVWSDQVREGNLILHATLTTTEIPIDTIKYHAERLRKGISQKVIIQVWPVNIVAMPDDYYHFNQIAPGIWLADRRLTDTEIKALGRAR
jgi:hypothetical protein